MNQTATAVAAVAADAAPAPDAVHAYTGPAATDLDVRLMLAVRAGDGAAFGRLVERHHRRVVSLAYRFARNATEAEDLAQEVLLRVWRSRRRYRPQAKFTTWLYHVAVNVCLNGLRKAAKRRGDVSLERPRAGGDGPLSWPDSRAAPPETDLQRTELRRRVREAVRSLPPSQQAAVILSRYEGLTYAEIADALGCSTAAVRSLLTRARETLKEKLVLYVSTGRRLKALGSRSA